MSLSSSILQSEFLTIIAPSGHPTSKALAASAWATAYDNYVRDTSGFGTSLAVDASGDAIASVNKSGFESALSFSASTAASFAAEWRAAFEAYWSGAAFSTGILGNLATNSALCPNVGGNSLFGSEISSVVSAVSGAALETAILGFLGSDRATHAQAATDFAALFHTATTSNVTVLISGLDTTPPGSGGPLPITNTCTVS